MIFSKNIFCIKTLEILIILITLILFFLNIICFSKGYPALDEGYYYLISKYPDFTLTTTLFQYYTRLIFVLCSWNIFAIRILGFLILLLSNCYFYMQLPKVFSLLGEYLKESRINYSLYICFSSTGILYYYYIFPRTISYNMLVVVFSTIALAFLIKSYINQSKLYFSVVGFCIASIFFIKATSSFILLILILLVIIINKKFFINRIIMLGIGALLGLLFCFCLVQRNPFEPIFSALLISKYLPDTVTPNGILIATKYYFLTVWEYYYPLFITVIILFFVKKKIEKADGCKTPSLDRIYYYSLLLQFLFLTISVLSFISENGPYKTQNDYAFGYLAPSYIFIGFMGMAIIVILLEFKNFYLARYQILIALIVFIYILTAGIGTASHYLYATKHFLGLLMPFIFIFIIFIYKKSKDRLLYIFTIVIFVFISVYLNFYALNHSYSENKSFFEQNVKLTQENSIIYVDRNIYETLFELKAALIKNNFTDGQQIFGLSMPGIIYMLGGSAYNGGWYRFEDRLPLLFGYFKENTSSFIIPWIITKSGEEQSISEFLKNYGIYFPRNYDFCKEINGYTLWKLNR